MYIVKKGDNLSKIAKNLTGSFSGWEKLYESNKTKIGANPNMIHPGLKLNTDVLIKPATQTKTSAVADQLKNSNKKEPSFSDQLKQLKTKRDELFKTTKDFHIKTYNDEYKRRGLDTIKNNIQDLDNEIQKQRKIRDDALARIKRNPGASAATLTGEIRVATEQLNSGIQNLINRRNAYSQEYNQGVNDIERYVNKKANDLKTQFGYYDNQIGTLQKSILAKQKAIADQLKETDKRDWEKKLLDYKLANDLLKIQEQAKYRKKSAPKPTKYQVLTHKVTGQPIGYVDPRNPGKVFYYKKNTTSPTQTKTAAEQRAEQLIKEKGSSWWPF